PSLLIDVAAASERIGPRTRAILAVDLYGQLAEMERLAELARRHDLLLLEDAAQAHGASRNGAAIGGLAAAAATSFYPGKNLGAYGDAGAVLTNDDDIAQRVRALRNYGSVAKYQHEELGFNSRLDALQAVVLNSKLPHLDEWNQWRRDAARLYDQLLADVAEATLLRTLPGNLPVWHLYVIRVPRRDLVLERLNAAGIGAAVHYPTPIHLQGAFRNLGHRAGDFPVSEAAAGEILSLPMYPGLTAAQQEEVVACLRQALRD
ncbi:MAG TPA: DegT/DnrJ/EryC1/StrS family aminotransferase, partial [Terriglobales bacterium]|nr:DegT/DnrJ/EryC1/StrS family aminotransferase [Terriglobales bacterium]